MFILVWICIWGLPKLASVSWRREEKTDCAMSPETRAKMMNFIFRTGYWVEKWSLVNYQSKWSLTSFEIRDLIMHLFILFFSVPILGISHLSVKRRKTARASYSFCERSPWWNIGRGSLGTVCSECCKFPASAGACLVQICELLNAAEPGWWRSISIGSGWSSN